MYEKYEDEIHIIAIDVLDKKSDALAYIEGTDFQFPIIYDSEMVITDLYKIRPIPVNFFIDSSGKITNKVIGAISEEEIEENIKGLIGDK